MKNQQPKVKNNTKKEIIFMELEIIVTKLD